jgi:upstream activation factor subunit UAF30
LIENCFDRVTAEDTNGTNGASPSPSDSPPQKRKEPSDESDLSDVVDDRPTKKRKQHAEEDDAAYAARLQREENSRARPTRAGATRKAAPVKRKKKTPAKVKDGSDVETNGESKPRTGGFHVSLVSLFYHLHKSLHPSQKPMNLSEPLSALLGETQLSRPQTVKKIWEYVKLRDLQDPADKRQIVCDDAMRAVFKTDRVHMFTMNKILTQNLYAAEDVVATTPAPAATAGAPASAASSPAPDTGSSP